MAKTITIDGTDYQSSVRLESLTLVESANRGEVGMGGFIVDDPNASIVIPALKAVTVAESLASATRVFTGYTQLRRVQRGKYRVGSARQWDVEVYDINTLMDDFVLNGSDADRPAETDYQRVTWLLTTRFNSVGGVSAGVVPNTNTTDMDAIDYRGKTPREVLEDCGEKAYKNFFLYRFGSGPLLFYDKHGGTGLTSTLRLSTVFSDVDNSTTWAALVEPEGMTLDPDRVYSSVRLKYKKGIIRKTDAGTLAAFRTREKNVTTTRVKSTTRADEMAQNYLDRSDSERTDFSMSVRLPAANVNDVRAGERIQVKAPYLDISSFTYYRVIRRTVSPALGEKGLPTDQWYHVRLEFRADLKNTRFEYEAVDWEEKSNATEDDANVVMDRDGINITGGAITVTNGNSVVIIDGSSDILQVVASGTLTVPRNTKRGDVKRSVWVPTGLTVDPMTFWSIKRPGKDGDGDWSQTLPLVVHSLDGRILEYYGGRARYVRRGVAGVMTDGTEVQAIKGSTSPPLDARIYRYRVMKQAAL